MVNAIDTSVLSGTGTASIVDVRSKLAEVRKELNSKYFERSAVIDGLLVSVLIGEHCLLLGEPGTGKSALSEDVMGFCFAPGKEDDYFECLMSDSLPPDELFGQHKISALRDDRYERNIRGRLPSARFAVLDEIFKCSTVLKTLFKLLNERIFYNDGRKIKCPLNTVVGASNELPEDGEGLEALWDRFLLRYWVHGLSEKNRSKLRMGHSKPLITQITTTELEQIQSEVEAIEYSKDIDGSLSKLEQGIVADGVKRPSDRRSKQFVKLLKGYAYLNGENAINEDHFSILEYAMWETSPDEMQIIRKHIQRLENPILQKMMTLHDAAQDAYDRTVAKQRQGDTAKFFAAAGGAITAIQEILEECDLIIGSGMKDGVATSRISRASGIREQIVSISAELERSVAQSFAVR